METAVLDPYEQQLLAVFNRYDYEGAGSLDKNGLLELCHTLQLQEQGSELVKTLLNEPQKSRVKFVEFKEALLTLLGNMQKKHDDPSKTSPEREVSPKYIYGSKKYGRRSRPKAESNNEEQNDLNYLNTTGKETSVQRSNSEVCNSKKRRTNFKLKRCTSLPSRDALAFCPNSENEAEIVCTEEMLRKAWKTLGVGEDGHLNKSELVLVCNAIGLHNLANGVIRQLADKHNPSYDDKISFQELLEVLKNDETWLDVLNPSDSTLCDGMAVHATDAFPDSQTFQFISLGPDGNGVVTTDAIIEMWESVGITAPKELLHDLGFDCRQINVAELAAVLGQGLKSIQDTTYNNPHISLLQASLTLYQSEIRCLKTILEQLNAEREKLKGDVTEANNRATLLAQEVDDNHQKMQETSQNQLRLMEQRHADILRDLTVRYSDEKEEFAQFNQALEKKITNLEQETNKLKNDLATAKTYLATVETENGQLLAKVNDLNQTKQVLQEQVLLLENECHKYNELEHEKIKPLLEKLSRLEIENGLLRDQSDEMGTEIEILNGQLSTLKGRTASSPVANVGEAMDDFVNFCDGNGLGAKRRNEGSPSKDINLFNSHDNINSPRLGKIRKLPGSGDEKATSGESSGFFGNEIEFSDCSFSVSPPRPSSINEVKKLQAKIVFLELLLEKNNISIPSDDDLETVWTEVNNVIDLKNRITYLEGIIDLLKREFRKLDAESSDAMIEKLSELILKDQDLMAEKINRTKDVSTTTEESDNVTVMEQKMKQLEQHNKELIEKCTVLESCIDSLSNEYEKCEDYWSKKMNEERQTFEQEQTQSNEKFAELFEKLRDYEEQFAEQDSRLPPIAETDNLEKQFTDLEEEYDEYRTRMESLVSRQDEEIELLKRKLTEIALEKERTTTHASVQVNDLLELTSHVIECTNLTSKDTLPGNWTTSHESSTDYRSRESPDNSQASSSSSTPSRPKRTRKHERDVHRKKSQESSDGTQWMEQQNVPALLNTVQGLKARKLHLEQTCRHLQMVVKEQRFQAERMLQQYWKTQQGERAEMQCMLKHTQEKLDYYVRVCKELSEKLARSDILVKDLFVENSYLIANVQRLEQQRNIFAHCSSNNSL